jgi:hypothetical protein
MKLENIIYFVIIIIVSVIFLFSGCTVAETEEITPDSEYTEIAENYKHLLDNSVTDYFSMPSETCIEKIINFLAARDMCVVSPTGRERMNNPQKIEALFKQGEATDGEFDFIQICEDGGFWKYDFEVSTDTQKVKMTRVSWNLSGNAEITAEEEYKLSHLELTEKGWLIFERIIPGNPESKSVHDGYIEPVTIIKVSEADRNYLEACEQYILPVGYDSGLFTENWGENKRPDYEKAFLSLYERDRSETINYTNCPWRMDEISEKAYVPSELFEEIICKYFDVTMDELKTRESYNGVDFEYEIDISRINYEADASMLYPEVVKYEENKDGTITLTVDAVWSKYKTDRAFTNIVTILPQGNDFKFISNDVQYTSVDI